MKLQLLKISTLIIAVVCLLQQCKFKGVEEGIHEGKMIYNIDYLASEESNPLITLLPNNLEMSFKNNNILMIVEGWMGIFKSGFLRTCKNGETLTLMKVMSKKYYYLNINQGDFMGVTSYTDLEIVFDDKRKNIVNYNCKHAVVTIPHKNVSFDVYYTDEIGIDNPNEGTPFFEIPGVLMEFQLEMSNIPMHIIVDQVQAMSIDDKVFDIPKGYEKVEKAVVDELLGSLLEN